MNLFYIVDLRRGQFIERICITNATTKEGAVKSARQEVHGLGWVVAQVEENLLTAPMPALTS